MAAAAEHVEAVGHREAIAAAGVLPGILQVDRGFQTGKILVDDQVDDAGNSVRAPGSRGAASHNVNALNQGAGNDAEVDARGKRGIDDALAIEQNQVAGGAEVAQIDARDAQAPELLPLALVPFSGVWEEPIEGISRSVSPTSAFAASSNWAAPITETGVGC